MSLESTTPPRHPSFSIVGIGASAGGYEAISTLLTHLAPDTGMAFVVVQHLAPKLESSLPELLAASARIPVVQVREGMALKPNRVHVIPPNVHMSVADGKLHLAPRPLDRTQYSPIDSFFESLASYAGDRAIGIVLSGSASDGAAGLVEIKATGGFTIAQEVSTAKYEGMPRAAIATGAVDLILPPDQIALELGRLAEHPFLRHADARADELAISSEQLEYLFLQLRTVSGVDFSQYRLPTIKRRLQRRMALHKLTSVAAYIQFLDKDPTEAKNLYRDVLIHVTRFFRDPESFAAILRTVFPQIVADAVGKRPIRIWVPGCATGEEAYSLAMILIEFLGDDAHAAPIQIFATDVSEEAVERARAGIYSESISADVSPDRLRRFFSRVDGQYRISKLVRDSCIFARQDLTRDPPFSKLDLIVCRNVLIYLGPRLQRKLMTVFHYALKPSGFLVLGSTESVGPHAELFAVIEKRHKIYAKRGGRGRVEHELAAPFETVFDRTPWAERRAVIARAAGRAGDIQAEASRLILGRYSPPGVVVDNDFQIIQTRGKTGPFLELATGEASLNALKMAREGLLHGLRSALQEARKTGKPTRREGLIIRTNDSTREVDLQVFQIGDPKQAAGFVVLFETPRRHERPRAPGRKVAPIKEEKQLTKLQEELSSSRDYLQSIIQDLEAANEELQSANEEILSSNEELQSTNEELDTAKEELQSTNEELQTVNEELNTRNDELSHVNSDLLNLLTAVPAAIVIVGADLRIRRFTPMAEQVLNLIPTDIGRPLGDIKPSLLADDLEELTREVIDSVSVNELDVRDRRGKAYRLRIRPYKDQENRINGAVLAFADRDEIRPRDAMPEAVLQVLPVGVITLDDTLQVRTVNRRARELLAGSSAATEAHFVNAPLQAQWSNVELRDRLERLRTRGETFSRVVLPSPHGAKLVVDARTVAAPTGPPLIVVTVQSVE